MRIISGTARGLKLDSLKGNDITRPTLDRVKESLFNILHTKISDSIVLDLFAGSGALGIECASRGAKKVTFCDKDRKAIAVIKQNVKKARVEQKVEIIQGDFKDCLAGKEKYDIIFLDPPYATNLAIEALQQIIEKSCLTQEGIVVIETDDEERIEKEIEKLSPTVDVYDRRKYGRVKLIFVRKG